MKVLFLDMDGVLNSDKYKLIYQSPYFTPDLENLDPQAVALLENFLQEHPDVVIVICSTWKRSFKIEELREALRAKGLVSADRIIDHTHNLSHTLVKGEEISSWLKDHPEVTHYVALDDGDDLQLIHPRQVKTSMELGLTVEDLEKLKPFFAEIAG